jgi:hypothetical protein
VIDSANSQLFNAAIWSKGGCGVQFQQSEEKQLSDRCIDQNLDILDWAKRSKPEVVIVSQFVFAKSPQKELRNALAVLKSVTPNVLLIENTPVFPDESRFMVRLPLLFPRYDPPKFVSQSRMKMGDKSSSNELGQWARENKVDTIDLSSLFCNNNLCRRYSDLGWLYSDDDHLSLEGAKLAAKHFDEYFKMLQQR